MPDKDVRQGPSRQDVESGVGRVLLKTLNLNTYKLLYTDSGSEISAYRLTSASVLHQLDKPQFVYSSSSSSGFPFPLFEILK